MDSQKLKIFYFKYLFFSWLYYEKNISLTTDVIYDRLCRILYENWNNFDHIHKHITLPLELKTCSCRGKKYPAGLIGYFERHLKEIGA